MSLLCLIVHLVGVLLSFFLIGLLILSVCLYDCVSCLCLWAMLRDLNKMMMMMSNSTVTVTTSSKLVVVVAMKGLTAKQLSRRPYGAAREYGV